MKKGSVALTFDIFDRSMDLVEVALINALYPADKMLAVPAVKETVVAGLAILFASEWEWFVRALMVDLLNRDTSRYAEYTGFRVRRDLHRDECRALLEGSGYLDFRSVGDLKGKAKQFLTPPNNPFDRINKAEADLIDDFFALRNDLAHQSRASQRAAERVVVRNGLKRLPTTSKFLVSRLRIFAYTAAFWQAEEDMRLFLGLAPRSKDDTFYTFYQLPAPQLPLIGVGALSSP